MIEWGIGRLLPPVRWTTMHSQNSDMSKNFSVSSAMVMVKSVLLWRKSATALTVVLALVWSTGGVMPAFGQDKLSKFLLIKLSREQSVALCTSDAFTSCMGFSSKECFALSEQAVEQCLQPLPDQIDIRELQNDTIEACPRDIYVDAGYSEDQAQACLQGAMSDMQGGAGAGANTSPKAAEPSNGG